MGNRAWGIRAHDRAKRLDAKRKLRTMVMTENVADTRAGKGDGIGEDEERGKRDRSMRLIPGEHHDAPSPPPNNRRKAFTGSGG